MSPVRKLTESAYFLLCLALGRILRSATYSKVRIVRQNGELQVRKSRRFHAPLLIWLGGGALKVLNAGVRILSQRDWEARERRLYQTLRGAFIGVDPGRMVVLPCLAGRTLAALLEDPALDDSVRTRALKLAVVALAEFHQRGFTHGDAMAENVMIDLDAGVAHLFDFETIHDPDRPLAWRRADDMRALLATCLLRTVPEKLPQTLQLMVDAYCDEGVTRLVGATFTSVWRRSLTFHLSQAGLPLRYFREIDRLLRERLGS